MNNLNTVLIEGQLTRDPNLSSSPAQTQLCKLSIANNRYFLTKEGKWQQDPSYFTVHVYGNVANACVARLKKGRGVRIVGRLKQTSWKVDGIWYEKIYILAEHIEFQPVKKGDAEPLQEPSGFETKSNLHEIEDFPADAAVEEPDKEPSLPSDDAPDCIIEAPSDEEEKEDYDQASGF